MHEANVKSKCKLDIRGDCKNVYLTGSKTFHSPVTSFEQSLEMVRTGFRLIDLQAMLMLGAGECRTAFASNAKNQLQ